MLTIPGYKIQECLYESRQSIIYKGKDDNGLSVIIKFLNKPNPSMEELARFRLEYETTRKLSDIDGVASVFALVQLNKSLAIVMEDAGGDSLQNIVLSNTLDIDNFFNIALNICQVIADIHSRQIMHKDINPSNIIWSQQTGEVQLIDFGITTTLTRENPEIRNPQHLEGTLAYISPEQTGRMNRAMDCRTDLYSLGATLYYILTKKAPFVAQDPIELVHCHLAKQPIAPHKKRGDVPPVLSNIILKLMAKEPGQRYQTVLGLMEDLKKCQMQLAQKGECDEFTLGCNDFSDRFLIPQKLYGREKNIKTLMSAFERVTHGGVEMMSVAGYSGIGKSVLVNEIHKPIIARRGFFVSGKFDQFKRDIPYDALIQAFKALVQQLLTADEHELAQYKHRLTQAFGVNGGVIKEVIPEMEAIIGPQPPVPELPPKEAQNRFNLVFLKMVQVFADEQHPLTIFLDDVQWSDVSSLVLLEQIMTDPDIAYLLVVVAYRDNEVDVGHHLLHSFDIMQKQGARINSVILPALEVDEVNQLVADTTRSDLDNSLPLAELCYKKTRGNPFFLNQFINALYRDGLIYLQDNSWQWEIEAIRDRNITDNVVVLMADKVATLSKQAGEVLQQAGCIGSVFDLETLSVVCQCDPRQVAELCLEALEEGLVLPMDGEYRLAAYLTKPDAQYRFIHDRVQEAAYSMIEPEQRQETHLKIGRLLLKATPLPERGQRVFDIVNQLNRGCEKITKIDERLQLAQLNFQAGCKAKQSAAFTPASNYFKIGLNILGEEGWQSASSLMMALHEEAGETAFAKADFADMEHLTTVALSNAKSSLDQVKCQVLRIQALVAQRQYREAVAIGLSILKELGEDLPADLDEAYINIELKQTRQLLKDKKIADLASAPHMTDPIHLATARILGSLIGAAVHMGSGLMPVIALKLTQLSARYGVAPISAVGYASYGGFILIGSLGEIAEGSRYGNVGAILAGRPICQEGRTIALHCHNLFIRHWSEPLRDILPDYRRVFDVGLENGDLEYASYAYAVFTWCSFLQGRPLPELIREMEKQRHVTARIRQDTALDFSAIFNQAALNLADENLTQPWELNGKICEEKAMLAHLQKTGFVSAICGVHIVKLMLTVMFKRWDEAVQQAIEAESCLAGVAGMPLVPVFSFYSALARLNLSQTMDEAKKRELISRAEMELANLKKWSLHAPDNIAHKWHLLQAEFYRVSDRPDLAQGHYDQAIELANKSEFINEEALAYELAGCFHIKQGVSHLARFYLLEAKNAYSRLGAMAKIKDLEKRYPELFFKQRDEKLNKLESYNSSTSLTKSISQAVLDLPSIIKASQAISMEMDYDKLVIKLLSTMLENAGAQHGWLILVDNGKMSIQAALLEGGKAQLISSQNSGLTSSYGKYSFPEEIIYYTTRMQEPLVLDDATCDDRFAVSKYVVDRQPKSILCVPLIIQGSVSDIIYLENNLATHTFTTELVEMVRLLGAQAAISLANARHISERKMAEAQVKKLNVELEKRVEKRTAELAASNHNLEISNRELESFSYTVSHDLRAPLRIINSFSEILLEECHKKLNHEEKGYLENIRYGSREMSAMIDGLLMLAKTTRGQLSMEMVDLTAIVMGVLNNLKSGDTKRNVRCDIAENLEAWGDFRLLKIVLENLVGNAWKYSETTDSAHIEFGAKQDGEITVFFLKDNGAGFDMAYAKKLFQPFQRLHKSEEFEGTGIGLATVQRVVQRHGGRIWADAKVGRGATFFFTLAQSHKDLTS
jgi:predicted ATPase/signal transduction histidine kinase/tRNA A-37 threonylcarbamoyl transferase component Bud32